MIIAALTIATLIYILVSSVNAEEYNRKNWSHWIDVDKDCQHTRSEVLIRDSLVSPTFKTSNECRIYFGLWICPYSGYKFKEPSGLDIDHVVPLWNAYKSGAAKWTKEQKRIFANDMDNLLAVQSRANRQKGASGPEAWRPKNKKFWKKYAFTWIRIKERYGLSYTQQELNALFIMMNTEE